MTTSEITGYRNHYSESKLWAKIRNCAQKLGKETVRKILLLYYLMMDPSTPWKYKTMIAGALGYLILPVDLIPDAIPVVGFTDDVGALVMVLKTVSENINPEIEAKADAKIKQWFN